RHWYQVCGHPWISSTAGPDPPTTACRRVPPTSTYRLVNLSPKPAGRSGAPVTAPGPSGTDVSVMITPPRGWWMIPVRPTMATSGSSSRPWKTLVFGQTSAVTTPETRYARSGDVNIAYQVVGDGAPDLVFAPAISHL